MSISLLPITLYDVSLHISQHSFVAAKIVHWEQLHMRNWGPLIPLQVPWHSMTSPCSSRDRRVSDFNSSISSILDDIAQFLELHWIGVTCCPVARGLIDILSCSIPGERFAASDLHGA